jgi:hypothetical protein
MLSPDQVATVHEHLTSLKDALVLELEVGTATPMAVPNWIKPLAIGIIRDIPTTNDPTESESIIMQDALEAVALYEAEFYTSDTLAVLPFLDNAQAGTPTRHRALWQGDDVVVVGSEHHHHRDLVAVIADRFQLPDHKIAVRDCIGRDAAWINGYFAENFQLRPLEEAEHELGLRKSHEKQTVVFSSGKSAHIDVDEPDDVESHNLNEDDAHQEALETPDTASPDLTDDSTVETHTEPNDLEWVQKRPHGQRLSPLKQYLKDEGFVWIGSLHYFVRPDGSTVRKEPGAIFHSMHDSGGTILGEYWESPLIIANGATLPAEVWHYIDASPDNAYIIAPLTDGSPHLIEGRTLVKWKSEGVISLVAASYRITMADQHAQSSLAKD